MECRPLIEAVMYFVLGLLAAGLVALALTPAVWRRAHRLAKARVESSLPMSLGEVQAEKDQLRASYAISARRLELQLAEAKETARSHTASSSRTKAEIAALTAAQAEKTAAIAALEARLASTNDALAAAEARTEAARRDVAAREATLVERSRTISGLEAQVGQLQLLIEEQRLELVARDTKIGNLEDQLAASRAAEAVVAVARDEANAAHDGTRAVLAAERKRREGLEAQIAVLAVERADRLAALDRRVAEHAALEAELSRSRSERETLAATVAALEGERAERLVELARLQTVVVASGGEAASQAGDDAGDNMRKALEAIEAEKAALEERLALLAAEHAAVVAENAELRRSPADAAGEASVMSSDDAIRGQLAEIAATVLRLTRARANGEGGPVANPSEKANGTHLHAVPPAAAGDEPPPVDADTKADPGRTLAERIRSLQHAARH